VGAFLRCLTVSARFSESHIMIRTPLLLVDRLRQPEALDSNPVRVPKWNASRRRWSLSCQLPQPGPTHPPRLSGSAMRSRDPSSPIGHRQLRSQPLRLTSVATSWQHPYRPLCLMRPESGRYGRFGRCWTYLHFFCTRLRALSSVSRVVVRVHSSALKWGRLRSRRCAASSGRAGMCGIAGSKREAGKPKPSIARISLSPAGGWCAPLIGPRH
jgi:hypothetical protein